MTRRRMLSIPLLALARRKRQEREVLAFYYGWYERSPRPEGTAHEPLGGRYDSHDPIVLERQVNQMKSAGITGLIVSWWRPGDYQDRGMAQLLDAAGRAGLKVTIYYEVAKPREAPTPQATAEDLLDILKRHGKHPVWLRVKEKAVVFVYSRSLNELHLSGWEQVIHQVNRRYAGGAFFVGDEVSKAAAKVFDGIHAYNPTGQTAGMTIEQIRTWARANYPKWVATAGKRISSVTVIPGYDDTKLNRPAPRPTTDRWGGETYRVLWEEAIAAHPDWILITSWNEWHEGSEIEPSVENGERELKATGEFARLWRQS